MGWGWVLRGGSGSQGLIAELGGRGVEPHSLPSPAQGSFVELLRPPKS